MPIRTNRGRAAVYRRLWGWPMRSPWHLLAAAIGVLALIVAAGVFLPKVVDIGSSDPARTGASSGSAQREADDAGGDRGDEDTPAGAGSPLPTRLSEPLASPTKAPPDPRALRVAEDWVGAWLTGPGDGGTEQWLDGLRPYTTKEYLARMGSANPERITATQVVGAPRVRESYTSSVEVEIDTDGPALVLTVIRTDEGWRVADYREAVG